MFGSPTSPAANYRNVGLETELHSATPHKLVLMLFDGALVAVANAQRQMADNDVAGKGQSISQAIDIITNGLQASLDLHAGGELAERLEALYEYMASRLLHANLRNDVAALKEVAALLNEIRGAWEKIAEDHTALSPNGG